MKTTTKTTKIPSRPREEWAVKEARIFIQESGLNWLPIDPFKIIKQYNWKVRTVGDLSRKTGIPRDQVICGTDSDLWECNGKYCIVYNEKAYRSRIPFTIAHEISHIVLGHLKEFPHLNSTIIRMTMKSAYWIVRPMCLPQSY